MNLGHYRFSPPLLAILATVLVSSLLAGLGRWQLERMYQKRQILEQYQQRQVAEPSSGLPSVDDDLEKWRYRRVRLNGRLLSDRQFLLDNQVLDGRVGFNVLTPMELDDGRTVLIDRGWVAMGAVRKDIPDVRVTTEINNIVGTIYIPFGKPFALSGATVGEVGWPRIVQYLDFIALGDLLGSSLMPMVVRMSPQQSGGYQRKWQIIPMSADKHLAYAVQWFALAAMPIILLLALNLKRRR
ncbi:MAG: SURF1 family protein [Chromatiales bacterium]|nr:SURF1 family protein [Chromatiales bacterium]